MSSNSDDDRQIFSCRKTRKKRKSFIEDSDSSSDQDVKPNKTPQLIKTPSKTRRKHEGTRSSERIQEKQSKVFSMPKKEDVWNKIPSTSTPSKVLDQLKPRKIVSDFTKINHRYNYDPVYTDDEDSSLDGFIANDDDDESDDESFEEENEDIVERGNGNDIDIVPTETKNQNRGVVGYRKRIQQKTDSSDDSSNTEDLETEEKKGKMEVKEGKNGGRKSASRKKSSQHKRTRDDDDDDDDDDKVTRKRTQSNETIKNNKISSAKKLKLLQQKRIKNNDIDGDSSDSDVVSPIRTHKRSIVESDNESDSCSNIRKSTVTMNKYTTTRDKLHGNSDFSSDEIIENLPLNQIIECGNKDTNDNQINIIKKKRTPSHDNDISISDVVFNSDSNQNNEGINNRKTKCSKKSRVHVIESSDSNSEGQDSETIDVDDDDHESESTAEESSSNCGENSIESVSSNEDTSEHDTSRSALQQRKRNQEREKKFEKFKEARKRFTTLKSPKQKES